MTTKKAPAKGMKPPPYGVLTIAPTPELDAYYEEVRRRMEQLADSLGIADDSHRWYVLAFELARKHVPELMIEKPRGAPTKWGPVEHGILAVEVEREKSDGRKTDAEACRALAVKDPWRSFLSAKSAGSHLGGDPPLALLRQLNVARERKIDTVFMKVFTDHVASDTVAQWDRDVNAIGSRATK